MEIKSLSNTTLDKLFEAFEQAFADYEVQLNKAELLIMLKRRGFNPKASFGAFDGDKLVSFTCNGIGDFYGKPTAYDTGTGTLKDYQGRGLATQVFEYSIPHLKESGVEEYLLEVLQHNTGALSVYRKLGFEIIREFYYFKQKNKQINGVVKTLNSPYILKPIKVSEHNSIPFFWDFKPSWQNSFVAINNTLKDFICLGVFSESKLVGYGVFEPVSGDVTQIAVAKEHRRKGIGSLLFQKMLESNKHNSIKIINTDIDCNSITAFLKSKNIEPAGKQFEMIKKL
ncbi:GNAT family N-acetyltransferase [Bacteroides fragilis]|uniref:GNAT family N-acetyltransferase n=1 Tax=Bacteroides fragilis TaxID=817 RepID=UPI001C70704E|nr:GNAT family N-acetyltransferase [Bacteroides fragilis]MBW9277316.1 GNAT family N-acetyltransferase [Bacteroides fragilis]